MNAITYILSSTSCAFTNTFNYKVVDADNGESPEATVTISATGVNCIPTSTDFTKTITGADTIDFTTHVSDADAGQSASLTIKLTS
jgi:hypothetical protein